MVHSPAKNQIFIGELSSDLSSIANYSITAEPLPEKDTEGLALFKRRGLYYLLQGSCCCQCTWGSNLLVYTAARIEGPWTRRGDVNPVSDVAQATHCQLACHSSAGASSARKRLLSTAFQRTRIFCLPAETGAERCNHTIHGQLNAVGQLRTASGELVVLALIDRWLSAPGANPAANASNCVDSSKARNAAGYVHGDDYQYWAPLEFEADGSIAPLAQFQDRIVVPLKTTDGVDQPAPKHLNRSSSWVQDVFAISNWVAPGAQLLALGPLTAPHRSCAEIAADPSGLLPCAVAPRFWAHF